MRELIEAAMLVMGTLSIVALALLLVAGVALACAKAGEDGEL